MRASIASEIVRLYAKYYGRGPTRARTHLGPDYALTVLEDVLTQAERTLVGVGRGEYVRTTRLVFQEALRQEFVAAIERTTGRRVRAFLSQNQTDPEVAVELFLFEPEDPDGDEERGDE
jgi:uncharacterized protein YbcI